MERIDVNSFWNRYNTYKSLVDRRIRDVLSNLTDVEILSDASKHLILSGGKRIRPILTLATVELLGGGVDEALDAAVAVEFLHNFTLIHDDIMDNDDFRRGVPTTHVKFGVPLAILAGDYLFSIVFKILSDSYSGSVAERLVNIYSDASMKICEGQAIDMNPRTYIRDENDYIRMIYLKTGVLIEASMAAGSIVVGKLDELDRVREIGRNMGIAFQIADDLLGLLGDPGKTGKPVGNDIKNGKLTLPIIYSLHRMGDDEIKYLEANLGNKHIGDEDLKRIVELIDRYGGIKYSMRVMNEYAGAALKLLSHYPDNEPRRFLEAMIKYIVNRDR